MDNIPRILPEGTRAVLQPWPVPAQFLEVMKRSAMSWDSMLKTLNCGLGMVWVVKQDSFTTLADIVAQNGFTAFDLGKVVPHSGEADWQLADPTWEGLDL